MNKKVSTIIVSCFFLLLSCIIFIVFLAIPFNKSDAIKPLTVYSQDYDLLIGESVDNFYQVSKQESIVSYEIENDEIVMIKENKLIAKKIGYTNITIYASYEEEQAKTTICVNVCMDTYTLNIKPIFNCQYEDENLYLYDNLAQFVIEILDKNNNPLKNVKIKMICNYDIKLYQEFITWNLNTDKSCQIIIMEENINCCFLLNVIVENQ